MRAGLRFVVCLQEAGWSQAQRIPGTNSIVSHSPCAIIHKILHDHKIHLLSVNETHLDSSYPDCHLQIPGYTVHRKDRNLNGGGVCFFAQLHLRTTNITPACYVSLESLYLKISIPAKPQSQKFIMCTVYRPPASTVRFWDDFSARLDGVSRVNPNVIVLGDMNTDVLRPDKSHYYRHLQELCSEHCLRNVVTVATRSPSDTCLDLLLIPVTLSCNTPLGYPPQRCFRSSSSHSRHIFSSLQEAHCQ